MTATDPADLGCRDSVDAVLAQWASLRSDLDFGALAITLRLARLRGHLEAEVEPTFRSHGLSTPDFAALITLIRISGDGGVSQHRLAHELDLTPGTVSVRIDRLVNAGLAVRGRDPLSKRRVLIEPTNRGQEIFERVISDHLATEERLLAALTSEERNQLVGLLRTMLAEFDGSQPAGLARLGLDVAPAHENLKMRAAVGLPPAAGLLVRAIGPGSLADQAGLRSGDLIIQVGNIEVRSRAHLDGALHDVSGGAVRLIALRGNSRVQLAMSSGLTPPK